MNSQGNIKRRILQLYPVKFIKDSYNKTGKQDEVINEIATEASIKSVYNFAVDNICNTKQHIYFYDCKPSFSEHNFDTLKFPIEVVKHSRDATGYHIHCMPEVECSGTIRNKKAGTYNEVAMIFCQPITITITAKQIIIKATKIEIDIESYLSGGNNEAFATKKNVVDDFTGVIVDYFRGKRHTVVPTDINKGIKILCDEDILDFRAMKVFKNQSTANEVMNGENTDQVEKLGDIEIRHKYLRVERERSLCPLPLWMLP